MYKDSKADRKLAYKWTKKAEDKNVVGALNDLGVIYLQGIEVKKDL
jgi:TPR repeat protein